MQILVNFEIEGTWNVGVGASRIQLNERGRCIKGLKWPPFEQKTEICFSQTSLDSFIRRMAEV